MTATCPIQNTYAWNTTSCYKHHPELAAKLPGMPLKVFSGKVSPQARRRAVFFCYRIPRPDPALVETDSGEPRWSDAAGLTVWVCYDLDGKRVLTEPGAIAGLIRSEPDTPRHCAIERTRFRTYAKKSRNSLSPNI